MVHSTNLNRDLIRRALATGVPRRITIPFLKQFKLWVSSSGEEWTVNRLKSIKLDILRKKAGLPPTSSWISRGKASIFGGTAGALERWMFSHPKRFSKGLQLLQVYTILYAKKVTPSQKKKFVQAVTCPGPLLRSWHKETVSLGLSLSQIPKRKRRLPVAEPIEFTQCSPNRRGPTLWGSKPEEESLIDSIGYLIRSYVGQIHLHKYKEIYSPLLKNVLPMLSSQVLAPSPYSDKSCQTLEVGRIGLIQEAGYKLRAVANPGRIFQEALRPLGNILYGIVSSLPWDCTFDQSRAFPYLMSYLQSGRKVYSTDLSNATDYFPLELQMIVLKYLFPYAKEVDLFKEISQSDWIMPGSGKIQWKRGQPLGLYPSFATFTLTHGIILLGLLGHSYNGEFFVLGDDVVILDEGLNHRYRTFLDSLGCPVSDSKSLSSDKLCEFAGKVILPDQVISQLKWRNISDESFIDISRSVGPNIIPILKNRQRRVIESIAPVPDFLGGLGWNPKGLPLGHRLPLWVFNDKEPPPRLTGYLRVVIRNFYSSSLLHKANIPEDFVYRYVSDLDQRSTLLVKKFLGDTFVPLTNILGKNLSKILDDSIIDLPIEGLRGTYRSTLQKMESRLGILRQFG